ncbi:uncharacterized protein LOC121741295 [Salvia splendens]|uniref:uncharacterized protein LOC121741295 n=1 Tax=Salvia splendens TaxID=180675 RepID=UPI001C26E9DA|nr:uncharacterized protein LOC121741295 [Salvia splendens]
MRGCYVTQSHVPVSFLLFAITFVSLHWLNLMKILIQSFPIGQYYLCDNGYANSEGFLTPYKGVRYHLQEWGPAVMVPENPKEMYNMRHTKARNVIERAFAVVKMRWGILRSASFYPITTQIRLILSCFLLHNFIRDQMTVDPIEQELDVEHIHLGLEEEQPEHNVYVDTVEPTPAWNNKRNELAETMWLSAGNAHHV